MLALVEQLDPGHDADLGTAFDQLRELIVCEAIEEAQRSELVDAHQIVAR